MATADMSPLHFGVDLKAGVKRRYSFRRGEKIQEVDCVLATRSGWEGRPEARDDSWNVGHIGPLVLALRFP